jgi:hypothetical protein
MRTRLALAYVAAGLLAVTARADDRGATLSQQYCGSCHVRPDPSVLDKSTWTSKVFPMMRQYMGLDPKPELGGSAHDLASFYPAHPMMTEDDWFTVASWYLDNAPQRLPIPERIPLTVSTRFSIDTTRRVLSVPPMAVMTMQAPGIGGLAVGHAMKGTITHLSDDGQISTINVGGPPVSVTTIKGQWYIANMGNLLPHDSAVGSIVSWNPQQPKRPVQTVIKGLRRPTHVVAADLNGNGKQDLVVCEFGNRLGRFGWYENTGRAWKYHSLANIPGAVRSEVIDLDGNGLLDIVVLMAQSMEGIIAYKNLGRGRFEQIPLLQFHPAFGASSFRFADLDGNGNLELIVTAGDNGDYEDPPLKPYHGVYVYAQQSPFEYSQTHFLPQHGAYGTAVVDIDLDGDLDIICNSFFADYTANIPDAALVWERHSDGSYTPSSLPGMSKGRWLTMATHDVDGDGDEDIILGNAAFGPGAVPEALQLQWTRSTDLILVLENHTR